MTATNAPKVINLWGGPNTGKSTTAAGLFYLMKINGYSVELVTEYAKDMTYEQRSNILSDQLYILAKQNRKLERLRGHVEWIITDSPVLLGLQYTRDAYYANFKALAFDVWDTYTNVNFYLNNSNIPYQNIGRSQTREEARAINANVENFLKSNNLSYIPIDIIPNNIDPFTSHIAGILRIVDQMNTGGVLETLEDLNSKGLMQPKENV